MPEPREPVPEPPRTARTALQALRTHLGWVCCAGGVLLCALGWYGVSGERYTARQIPYLASATAPGAALIIGGTVLLAARRRDAQNSPEQQRNQDQMQRQLAVLYQLLTDAVKTAEGPPRTTADSSAADSATDSAAGTDHADLLLAVPGGRTYHRTGCLLVQGRQDPERLIDGTASQRGLRPCPLCDPPEV